MNWLQRLGLEHVPPNIPVVPRKFKEVMVRYWNLDDGWVRKEVIEIEGRLWFKCPHNCYALLKDYQYIPIYNN